MDVAGLILSRRNQPPRVQTIRRLYKRIRRKTGLAGSLPVEKFKNERMVLVPLRRLGINLRSAFRPQCARKILQVLLEEFSRFISTLQRGNAEPVIRVACIRRNSISIAREDPKNQRRSPCARVC